ncbi:SAM-dependent methyltransferase [Rhodovulum sp. P5]|nr:SAM-dependent methyltransferase [Rhodovulum sp. P5]
MYDIAERDGLETLYDKWASTYDDELTENSYVTPARIARAMAQTGCRGPVLDVGCGTGLSGLALTQAGYDVIDGCDISEAMVAEARAKGVYRTLTVTDPDKPLPVSPGSYPTIAAVGVVTVGAAPADLLDDLADALAPGGRLAFSFNDHALAEGSYVAKLGELLSRGFSLRFREYGPHIRARDLGSTVYVIEKRA